LLVIVNLRRSIKALDLNATDLVRKLLYCGVHWSNMDEFPVAINPLKPDFLLSLSLSECEMNDLALVAMGISEVDVSLEDVVNVLAGAGALKSQHSRPPDLAVEVPENDLLGVVGQE
jgi:hypothetical protein